MRATLYFVVNSDSAYEVEKSGAWHLNSPIPSEYYKPRILEAKNAELPNGYTLEKRGRNNVIKDEANNECIVVTDSETKEVSLLSIGGRKPNKKWFNY